jgi:glycosyltransferase involved in cell wall biosynthesis
MYAGNFGELQGLETVLEAAALLRSETRIGFALVGGGVVESRLRQRAADLALDNVTFVPPQPFSGMSELLALGDAQLVTLKDVPLLRSTLPSKLQANLAVGKPVVGAVTGDAADVIRRSGAGVVSAPGDARGLAAAIREVAGYDVDRLTAMGERAREYYLHNFSEKVVGDRLSEVLESVVKVPTPRRPERRP